jgi:hypothetical protein
MIVMLSVARSSTPLPEALQTMACASTRRYCDILVHCIKHFLNYECLMQRCQNIKQVQTKPLNILNKG